MKVGQMYNCLKISSTKRYRSDDLRKIVLTRNSIVNICAIYPMEFEKAMSIHKARKAPRKEVARIKVTQVC